MDNTDQVQAEGSARGWLVFRFRQDLLPAQYVRSTLKDRYVKQHDNICSGLSALWCHARLGGPLIDFPKRQKDDALAWEAARLQMAAYDENIGSLDPQEFDRRIAHAKLACYPNDFLESNHLLPITPILQMCGGSSARERRICMVTLGGIEQGSSKELNSWGWNWGHAIAFEANGPGLTLFDPNFGEFRASGTARQDMLFWLFAKAAYQYVQLKRTYIYRVRPTG